MGINLLSYWEHLTGGNGLMIHFNYVAPAVTDIKYRRRGVQYPVSNLSHGSRHDYSIFIFCPWRHALLDFLIPAIIFIQASLL